MLADCRIDLSVRCLTPSGHPPNQNQKRGAAQRGWLLTLFGFFCFFVFFDFSVFGFLIGNIYRQTNKT